MADLSKEFTSQDSRENGVSGVLVPDEKGYLHAIFTATTRESLKKTFGQLIRSTIEDYKPIDARRDANLKAYEALSAPGQAITLPVVKRDVNQQLAWHLDAIFSKEPPFTVQALDSDPIDILVDESGDGSQGQVMPMPADEYARQLQALVNFYMLHRVGFKRTLRAWIFSLLQDGNRPPILKVIYDDREREVRSLNAIKNEDGEIERIETDPVYKNVKDGEPTRIEGIPGDKFFIPLPWSDIQQAPFVFQEFEEDIATIKDKIARGIYNFCREGDPPQEEIDAVISGCKPEDVEKWRADGRTPADPTTAPKMYELWFDYPFAEPQIGEDGRPIVKDGQVLTVTRMVPFCAVVHGASDIWLNCYENYRWDRKRPFFPGRQQDRPHSFSGYSTAENVAPFQVLMTQLFNAQLQNIAVSNVATFGFREGSPTHRFFAKTGAKLRPGLTYPFGDPSDILRTPLGVPVGSMANEVGFLNSEAEKMSLVTQYDRGSIPNRTPVGTVTAVDEQAKMQPKMALDNLRDTIAEVLECFVRTIAQFNPGGVRVPFRDEHTAEGTVVRTVGFPLEWREGTFAFTVTATGTEETAAALTQRDMMLGDQITKINGENMQTMQAGFMPDTPAPLVVLAMNMMRGRRNMFARVLLHNKLNPDDYLPTQRQIEQLPIELQQLQEIAKQAQQAPPQTGDPNGGAPVPPAPGGEVLPFAPGGGAPIPGMAGQPGDQGAGGMAPQAGL